MDWESYSFVVASVYRKKILKSLLERPKIPSEIKNDTSYYLSHVSNVLSELVKATLVECLTPSRSKGKVYKLTENGEKIANYLSEHGI